MLLVKRLTANDSLELDKINHLYDSAFPPYEKRSYCGRQNIQNHVDYHLYFFTDNNVFVGFIASWKINDFFYIEHLAIAEELRGQGYGQKVLTLFGQQAKKIILEIDPVTDDVSQKRLQFYQHCGFKLNQYKHIHPSYHAEFSPHQLEILSFPREISQHVYQIFNDKLQKLVMHPSLL